VVKLSEKHSARLSQFFRRHWQRALRLREKLRFSEEAFHLVLAGGVGVLGGVVNLVFFHASQAIKLAIFQRVDDPVELAETLDWWLVLFVPVAGGLGAGLVLYWGLRLSGPHRSSNLLEVVVAGDGRLPLRSALVKFCSSLLTINSGGSIGREGGITQMTATLASKCGQMAKWPPYRLRLLVGCGAASGMASAYNAPISGAVFAALIVLGNFSMNMFAPVVFSSVVAAMVSRTFFGIEPWYSVPPFEFTRVTQLPWFILLGLVTGVMGAVFLRMLRTSDGWFSKMKAPIFVRLAVGGAVVGLLALYFPGVWGNGYLSTDRILHGDYPGVPAGLLLLAGLFLAKLLATLATVGSGAVGGILTPTLFLGAGLGAAFGMSLHLLHGAQGLPISAFAVVGMGSMLSATMHSPLLAMIMIFEISLDYSLMPPLMLACVVSTLMARRFHPDSIYTEPLKRKGLALQQEARLSEAVTSRTVGDLMLAPVPPVRETATLGEIARRFMTSANNFLPVVDARGQLVGLVALQDLKAHLSGGDEMLGVIAYDLMRPPPVCVLPFQKLSDVLPIVLASEQRNIPVVNSAQENRLVGTLVRAEVLSMFSEAIARNNPGNEV
jgi:CIC family chloride channel protein